MMKLLYQHDYYFYGRPQPFSALIVTSQPVYRPPGKVDFKISLREMTGSGYTVFAGRNAVLRITDEGLFGVEEIHYYR